MRTLGLTVPLLWISVAYCASIATRNSICPDEDSIAPCTCESNYRNIECSELRNIDSLNDVLKNVGGFDGSLSLNSSFLEYFPPEGLANTSIHSVRLVNCHISSDSSEGTTCENVHHLVLENVTTAHDWFFDKLPNLTSVFLHNSTVGGEMGPQLGILVGGDLTHLYIAESNVSTVGQLALQNKSRLAHLRLTHSRLTSLEASALSQPSQLERLELDYNRISFLPDGVFSNIPNLSSVSLSNNALSSLPEEAFKDLWKPSISVELRGNPIKCDCRLLWAVNSTEKPRELTGQCAHPKTLFGKELKELTVDDLNCR